MLDSFSIPIWAMLVLTGLATLGTVLMFSRGHDRIMCAISLSMFWMFASYILFFLSLIDTDTKDLMIRAAIACLSLSLIAGSIIFGFRKRS